jgi:hypothetical protein
VVKEKPKPQPNRKGSNKRPPYQTLDPNTPGRHSHLGEKFALAKGTSGRGMVDPTHLRPAARIALLTMLPELGTFHYATTFTKRPMAMARPYAVSPYSFSAPTVPAGSTFAAGTTMIFWRRSVLQNLITYHQHATASQWHLDAKLLLNSGSATTDFQAGGNGMVLDAHYWIPDSISAALGFPLQQWSPVHDGLRAHFISATIDKPTTLTLTRPAPVNDAYDIELLELIGTEWRGVLTGDTLEVSWPAASTSFSTQLYASRYYAVRISFPGFASGTESHTIQMHVTGTSNFWRIDAVPDFNQNRGMFTGIRFNAGSCLLSPQCLLADRNGIVYTAQLDAGENWSNTIDGFTKREETSARSFTKGAFGYVKPSSADSYSLRRVAPRPYMNGTYTDIVTEELFSGTDTIAFRVQVTAGIGGTYTAAEVHVTTICGLEYETDSTWIQESVASLTAAHFASSLEVIKGLPQFFENETHGDQIKRYLRRAGGLALDGTLAAIKYAPSVLQLFALLAASAL